MIAQLMNTPPLNTPPLNTTETTLSIMPVTTISLTTTVCGNLTGCEPESTQAVTLRLRRLSSLVVQNTTVRDFDRHLLTVTAPPATRITGTTEGRRDAVRRRRLVPREHFDPHAPQATQPPSIWVTPAWQKDDVVSERIHAWRWRTDYQLADAFSALSNMSRPGEQVAALAKKLYEAGSDESFTSEQRDIFQTTGATFDLLSIFVPHVWIMKTVGTAGGIVAKALRNETITAQDVLDINGAFKGVVDQGVQSALTHQTAVWGLSGRAPSKYPGFLKAPRYTDLITHLYFEKNFGLLKKNNENDPLLAYPQESLMELSPAKPPLSRALPDIPAAVPDNHVLISLDEPVIRTAPVRQTIILQKALPVQSPVATGLSEAEPVLPVVVEAAANEVLEIANDELSGAANSEHSAVEDSEPSGAADSEPSGAGDSENSESANPLSMKARPALITVEALPERRWSDVSRETLALRGRARAAILRGKTQIEIDMASKAPPPLSYASSDGIHLLLQADEAGRVAWRTLPREWYRAAVIAPDDQMGVFSINDQEYVSIDDHTYAVRDISETALQVFNPADVSLPPLSVASVGGRWRFNLMLNESVDGILTEAGIDGFIRVNNKKYVRIGEEVFEVERSSIADEERIADVAQSIMEPLPSSDACGYIRWHDDKILIEGINGYYVVRDVDALGVVVMLADGKPVPMHYDHVLGRWHVAPKNRSAQRQDLLPLQHRQEEASVAIPLPPARDVFGSVSSLDISGQIHNFPFSIHWPKLVRALESSFHRLSSWRLIKPNRPHATVSERPIVMLYPIQAIRRAAYRLMPDVHSWNALSVLSKQQKAAAFTEEVYKSYFFLDQDLGAEAMCSEMTELLMVKMLRKLDAKAGMFSMCGSATGAGACLLEVQIKEKMSLGNTGRSHVALMAFKSREIMELGFGDLSTPHPPGSPRLKEMSNGEFRAFVHEHRHELLLIDPWAPKKIIDFAMAGGVDAALSNFVTNLQEARFGDFTATIGYNVQAFVPPRSGLASENSLEFDENPFGLDD